MNDFAVDGQPLENPVGGATELQARTAPRMVDAFAAQFHEGSTLEPLIRFAQRQAIEHREGSQGLIQALQGGEFATFDRWTLPEDQEPIKMLSAEEANKRYAPIGHDGKPARITEGPMPEGVAQLVGKAKASEIERQGILARYSDAHSWPVTFATGTAAFMLDPLNLGSAFIPGFGEEAITARLGAGFIAKATARLAAGASTGAVSQAPLTALRYGLGREEAADYELRDAFRDVAFAAAGTAVLHAGFGAAGDVLRARAQARAKGEGEALPLAGSPEANSAPLRAAVEANEVLGQNAVAREQSLRAAVSQVLEGKPVDVEPVMAEHDARAEAERLQIEQAQADIARLEAEGYTPRAPLPGAKVETYAELKARAEAIDFEATGKPEDLPRIRAQNEAIALAKGTAPIAPEDITVWHGSPHIFDEFDIGKIGTGEGAQAYGHGIYVAEAEQIGRQYQKALTTTRAGAPEGRAAYGIEGTEFPTGRSGHAALDTASDIEQYLAHRSMGLETSKEMADYVRGQIDARIAHWEAQPEEVKQGSAGDAMRALVEYWKKARNAPVDKIKETRGALYKVGLRGSAAVRMLDWDKSLSEQPAALKVVKAIIGEKGQPEKWTGAEAYGAIADALGGERVAAPDVQGGYPVKYADDAKASQALKEAGIPGIQYLDAESRAKGAGTRNFVVFDPQDLRIIERNGETPAAVATRSAAQEAAPSAPGIPQAEMDALERQIFGPEEAPSARAEAPPQPTPAPERAPGISPEQPLEQRVAVAAVATELARMRDNTGWAQEGGKHLGGKMGEPNFSTWIPREYWWPDRPKGLTEPKAKAAINKALAGEPLKAAERRFVEYATDIAESHVAGEQYAPTKAELKEHGVPVDNSNDTALVARASERNEDAVERAAVKYEDDYAGFMRAVKEIADAPEEHPGEEAAAPGRPSEGAREGGPSRSEGEAEQPGRARAPAGEVDARIADARARLATLEQQGAILHPEDRAEIERTQAAIDTVDDRGPAYLEAANCLKGST